MKHTRDTTPIYDRQIGALMLRGYEGEFGNEVKERLIALCQRRQRCPDIEVDVVDLAILQLLAPWRKGAILDIARQHFGRRRLICRHELAGYLRRLANEGLITLDAAGYAPGQARPEDWADACRESLLISVIDYHTDTGMPASVNPGSIRFDQPGDLYGAVTVMFAALGGVRGATLYHVRRYTRRLWLVRDA
jgi:hypothetical protein